MGDTVTAITDHVASCACGQLRVTATGEPDVVVACNCMACQKRTGSPFGVGAYYRRDRVPAIDGRSNGFERTAPSGRKLNTYFCPECGTSVYWTLEMRPDHYGIAVGCFSDPEFIRPARVVWAENRHHWVDFPDDMPVFDQAAS